MGEAVALFEGHGAALIAQAPPDESLIEELEQMLDRARSGQLRACGIIAVDRDRSVITTWVGNCDRRDLQGGVSILFYRFMKHCDED